MANKVKRNYFPSEQIEVRNKIANAIEAGIVKPGQKLPSVGSISHDQQVSYGKVRDAFSILEAENYIKKERHNRFTVIGPKHKPIQTNVAEIYNEEKLPTTKTKTYSKPPYGSLKKKAKQYVLEICESKDKVPSDPEIARVCKCGTYTAYKAKKELFDAGLLTKAGNGTYQINHNKNANHPVKHELKLSKEIPGTTVEKHESSNMEFAIINDVPGIKVVINQASKNSFEVCIRHSN